MRERDTVKAAARALDLFEALVAARRPLSLSELAQQIEAPISSCHALVRTLQARGYLYVMDARKRIYPTKRLAALSQGIARYDAMLERLGPVLHRLAAASGETVILGKNQGDTVVYLDVVDGTHTVRFTAQPGDVRPAHSSAIGKSTLSLMSAAQLDAALARLRLSHVTDDTITDLARLRADILVCRARGYAVSRGETVRDVMGVAVAQRIGGEICAIGIAGPIARMDENLPRIVALLREADADARQLDVPLDIEPAP